MIASISPSKLGSHAGGVSVRMDTSRTSLTKNPKTVPLYANTADTTPPEIHITIPQWVDDLIFNQLGASHAPAGAARSFDHNLHSSKDEINIYLGTYFPRSLAEAFIVFDNLLSDKKFLKLLSQQEDVSICSVGTGTGGDLLGLILALESRIPSLQKLSILSIEGNHTAHKIAAQIIEEASWRVSFKINQVFRDYEFQAPHPFDNLDFFTNNEMQKKPLFDFVITTKMLNELDCEKVCENPYYEFCEAFTKALKPHGTLAMFDVASPNGANGAWTPIRLNSQATSFIRDNPKYATLLPLLCGSFEDKCETGCYTQSSIRVSHSRKRAELCKSCYRVIGAKEFVSNIRSSTALWDCPITRANEKYCEEIKN